MTFVQTPIATEGRLHHGTEVVELVSPISSSSKTLASAAQGTIDSAGPEFLLEANTTNIVHGDAFAGSRTEALVSERWNNPQINISRILATFFSFLVVGMNDAASGALIPYVSL